MKKLLKKLETIEQEIYTYFGTTTRWLALVDCTDVYWDSDGYGIRWSDNEEDMVDEDREAMYSADIRQSHEGEEFTLFHIRLCTGDEESAIFDDSKRRKYM